MSPTEEMGYLLETAVNYDILQELAEMAGISDLRLYLHNLAMESLIKQEKITAEPAPSRVAEWIALGGILKAVAPIMPYLEKMAEPGLPDTHVVSFMQYDGSTATTTLEEIRIFVMAVQSANTDGAADDALMMLVKDSIELVELEDMAKTAGIGDLRQYLEIVNTLRNSLSPPILSKEWTTPEWLDDDPYGN